MAPGLWEWLSHMAHGAKGVSKAALGTDPADDVTVSRRRGICSACDQATRRVSTGRTEARLLTAASQCRVCRCNIRLKVSIASERCPLDKW